jgi:hypothetical protein
MLDPWPSPAGRAATYPNASEFRAYVVVVDGITSLAAVLDAVVTDGHAAVIRGAPGKFYRRKAKGEYQASRYARGSTA